MLFEKKYIEKNEKRGKSKNIRLVLFFVPLSLSFREWNIVEGDQKDPLSIATTLRCRGGRYSIPWITLLYSWYVPYNAEC